jgi:hypothetical protein
MSSYGGAEGMPGGYGEPITFRHQKCPVVGVLDAARATVVTAREQGVMDPELADQRLGVIRLRQIALAATQEQFGCPRGPVQEGEEVEPKSSFSCELPITTVDVCAFGAPGETLALLLTRGNNVNTGNII